MYKKGLQAVHLVKANYSRKTLVSIICSTLLLFVLPPHTSCASCKPTRENYLSDIKAKIIAQKREGRVTDLIVVIEKVTEGRGNGIRGIYWLVLHPFH